MRKWLLTGASVLALGIAAGPAMAFAEFGYVGSVVNYVVPDTGTYVLDATGGQGGSNSYFAGASANRCSRTTPTTSSPSTT